jgi:hypothetical protein
MSFNSRLFSKKGLPVLISIIAGAVTGFFINGALGLILATIAGFVILYLFGRLPFRLEPWQSLVSGLLPVVGKLSFLMIFLLPVASYLTLPSGHTPNTLTKYISIVVAVPSNLTTIPKGDVFPGMVIIVLISIALMLWGSFSLNKWRGWAIALVGLLLYTFSPTITSAINGDFRLRIIMSFFSIGYYLAWLGLILMLAGRLLPKMLPSTPSQPAYRNQGMMSVLPPVIAAGALSQMVADPSGHVNLLSSFDFESTHHFFAGVFSAGIAGVGAGVIVDGADSEENGEDYEPPEPEEPPESEEPEEPAAPEKPEPPPAPPGPEPFSDPDNGVPEGSTIQWNDDHTGATITKPDGSTIVATKHPDGTKTYTSAEGTTTEYTDGTTYSEYADGSKEVEYPDGTKREWSPDGTTTNTNPDGSWEQTRADGTKSSCTMNADGTMDVKTGDENLHFPKDGPPVGSMTGADGTKFTYNEDGTAEIIPGAGSLFTGGKLNIDKDGNMSGSMTDKDGNKFTVGPDGSVEVESPNGDTMTVDKDGNPIKIHVSGPEGKLDMDTDANGNGYIKGESDKGSFEIKTDDKGNTNIKGKDKDGSFEVNVDDKGNTHASDDKGNTMDIKSDGSGNVAGPDGNGSWDDKGNAEITTPEGVKWKASSDGSGSVSDGKGNKIELGKDGGLTVTDAKGQMTTYTPDQVGQMKANAAARNSPPDTSTGGA